MRGICSLIALFDYNFIPDRYFKCEPNVADEFDVEKGFVWECS